MQPHEKAKLDRDTRDASTIAVELPWSDCKVAFGFDDPEIFENWMERTDDGKGLLPPGWSLCEMDGAGARYVVVFRVEGPLRIEDGEAVAKLLSEIAA